MTSKPQRILKCVEKMKPKPQRILKCVEKMKPKPQRMLKCVEKMIPKLQRMLKGVERLRIRHLIYMFYNIVRVKKGEIKVLFLLKICE